RNLKRRACQGQGISPGPEDCTPAAPRCEGIVVVMSAQTFTIDATQAGVTLASFVRARLPGQSWGQIRRLIETRRTKVNGEVCFDSARRLKDGESVELLEAPAAKP